MQRINLIIRGLNITTVNCLEKAGKQAEDSSFGRLPDRNPDWRLDRSSNDFR